MKCHGCRSEINVIEGKCPQCGKEILLPGFPTNSGKRKPESFAVEEIRKSNEKLMEDIQKALSSSYNKVKKSK